MSDLAPSTQSQPEVQSTPEEEKKPTPSEQVSVENPEPKKLTAAQKKNLRKKAKKAAAKEHEAQEEGESEKKETPAESSAALPELQYPMKHGQTRPQTCPPTIPLDTLFPKHRYPLGQVDPHPDELTVHRKADPARLRLEITNDVVYNEFRQAAEAHRQTRAFARQIAKPGMELYDFCTQLEMHCRSILGCKVVKTHDDHLASSSSTSTSHAGGDKKKKDEAEHIPGNYDPYASYEFSHAVCGMSFPTGVSLNNCAAHYTPNPGDHRRLLATDLMKVDIGTHVNGHIIDSAFTLSFDPTFDTLIQASKEATWTGLRLAGSDARLVEIGDAIEETMTSFEVEIHGKTHHVVPVSNLSGHQIGDYIIHAGKRVPITKNGCEPKDRMLEGDTYAIETFASTGKGKVSDTPDCSHYMLDPDFLYHPRPIRNPKARQLLSHLQSKYRTLAWCRRWLEQGGEKQHLLPLKALVDAGAVNPYPPLADQSDSFVSQHEHTILIKPTAKEIVSFGGDD